MTVRRIAASVALGFMTAAPVAAQNGQGANAVVPSAVLSGVFVVHQQPGAPEFGPVYHVGNGVTMPTGPLRRIDVGYTEAAVKARIEGDVWIDAVVRPDGSVGDLKISKSLDPTFGLDRQAMASVSRWQFRPGTRQGVGPVPVAIAVLVEFRLPATTGTAQVAPATQPFGRGAHKVSEPGVTPPTLRRQVTALYSEEAMRARIMGSVSVEVVILADGTVGETRVTQALDPGLDELANKAVQRWEFEPARLNGQPVPSIAKAVIEFRLH